MFECILLVILLYRINEKNVIVKYAITYIVVGLGSLVHSVMQVVEILL